MAKSAPNGRSCSDAGKRYEREAAAMLQLITGFEVRRKLGEGRREDEGDLEGMPELTIQVKAYKNVTRAVNEGLKKLRRQQQYNATKYGVAMIRRPGGRWVMAMEPDQFLALYNAAMRDEVSP
jgi:hypothetical protein